MSVVMPMLPWETLSGKRESHIFVCIFISIQGQKAPSISKNRHYFQFRFYSLCQPNGFTSPFKPVRAQAFDLFPHTKHCEIVFEFRRV